jgi:hypothetical protein
MVKDQFDLVIFYECESNLAQFDSSTIIDFKETTDHFKTIMNNAKKTIWSDAFIMDLAAREHLPLRLSVAHSAIDHPPLGHLLLMDRSLKICEIFRPATKKIYIQNEFQPYKRR